MALVAPSSATSAPAAGFVDFDARVVSAHPGVVLVQAPADVHGPIVAHAARRLRTGGSVPVHATCRAGAPLFGEIARQLGLGAIPCDAQECASALATAATAQRAAILAPLPREGTWDRAVATELARAPHGLVIFVTAGELPAWEASRFEVGAELSAAERVCWLTAVAEEAQRELPGHDLPTLEGWWAKARRVVGVVPPSLDDLDPASQRVLAFLALAGRSLPASVLEKLAGEHAPAAVERLVAHGLVTCSGELVSGSAECDLSALEADTEPEMRRALARYLTGEGPGFEPDPWSYARAAELLVSIDAFDEADAAITKALPIGGDPQVNADITSRWFACLASITGPVGLTLRIQAAERSLLLGEAADAARWCEAAATIEPDDPTTCLLMAHAHRLLGDFVAARVCLAKAEANVPEHDDELAARIAVERAELSYLSSELDRASDHATRAIGLAKTAATRLAARGALGKVLLARGSWALADEHFAEDALAASAAGETTAELRARLNRGIALLSNGRLDEARTMLERVLEDGTRLNEARARAYALSNLGLVAYRQHDYGSALRYWEQTIRFPQALRGRVATAVTIANLADLRLRLGLVDHAEHAIAFGKRLLAGGATPRAAALFRWVAAQIALARGNTELARREIDSALLDAQASGDRDYLESAYLVAARVALEDGDLARLEQALAHAEQIARSPRARAEVTILRAAQLRAMGQPALDAANDALEATRASGDEDLLAEIHTLLAMLHRDAEDLAAAQAHCSRAIAVRDQIASGLPPDIRTAYLAKPEIVALSRLQSSLAHDDSEEGEEAPRTQRSVAPRAGSGPAREMVGDDPQIRNLTVAIRKVARSNSTVLIRGESGTGKELVAEALHRASDRSDGPLVSVNCAALVETLLLSELFGHEKGAFTGASARRRGRFELAEGGTLFLDEIGDISPRTQVALLRVLQEKTFERVGGTTPIQANVRVICATHRDLRAMVERGEFREDLYYRLRGITLEVPPLRARLGDLPKVAEHLLGRIAAERNEAAKTLAPDAVELLCRHRWPGNVRELENVLRAVSLFADGDVISAADLIDNVEDLRAVAQAGPASAAAPVSLRAGVPPSAACPPSGERTVAAGRDEADGFLPENEASATAVAYAQVRQGSISLSDIKRQIERDCIARALAETKGNITRAAVLLGMKRPRLSQLVKQYNLVVAPSEGSS